MAGWMGRKFDGQALLANVPGDAEATLSLAFTFSPRAQVLQSAPFRFLQIIHPSTL